MSKLFLNTELVRRAQRHPHEYYNAFAAVHGWELKPSDHDPRWYVCPACAWVALTSTGELLRCPRPEDDTMANMAATMFNLRVGKTCREADMLFVDELAPRVAAALSAALRMGGVNAVIRMLDDLQPIEIGLDDPGGRAHMFYFYEVRPGSAKNDQEGSWYCTYRDGNRTLYSEAASATMSKPDFVPKLRTMSKSGQRKR